MTSESYCAQELIAFLRKQPLYVNSAFCCVPWQNCGFVTHQDAWYQQKKAARYQPSIHTRINLCKLYWTRVASWGQLRLRGAINNCATLFWDFVCINSHWWTLVFSFCLFLDLPYLKTWDWNCSFTFLRRHQQLQAAQRRFLSPRWITVANCREGSSRLLWWVRVHSLSEVLKRLLLLGKSGSASAVFNP